MMVIEVFNYIVFPLMLVDAAIWIADGNELVKINYYSILILLVFYIIESILYTLLFVL